MRLSFHALYVGLGTRSVLRDFRPPCERKHWRAISCLIRETCNGRRRCGKKLFYEELHGLGAALGCLRAECVSKRDPMPDTLVVSCPLCWFSYSSTRGFIVHGEPSFCEISEPAGVCQIDLVVSDCAIEVLGACRDEGALQVGRGISVL
jgi:hypothetical protein